MAVWFPKKTGTINELYSKDIVAVLSIFLHKCVKFHCEYSLLEGETPPRPSRKTTPPSPTNSPDFTTPNPFAILPIDPVQPSKSSQPPAETSQPKPPPIFFQNVQNFNNLVTAFSSLIGELKFTCQTTIKQVILRTVDSDSCRLVTRYSKEKTNIHSYHETTERAHRVVIRDLHH